MNLFRIFFLSVLVLGVISVSSCTNQLQIEPTENTTTLSHFDVSGTWEGKWDTKWPVKIELWYDSESEQGIAIYTWKEFVDGPWSKAVQGYQLEGDSVIIGLVSITFDELVSDKAIAVGNFTKNTREAELTRTSRRKE